MRPSVVLLGFLLGSSGAITFGLFGVAFVFWVLGPEHPELSAEIGPLTAHLARFAILTAVAATSFYGALKRRRWRVASLAALAAVLGFVILTYLP